MLCSKWSNFIHHWPEIFMCILVLTMAFQLTLTIAPAAMRKSVARSLTVFIFAASSGDGGSNVSSSFKTRWSIVPFFISKSLQACKFSKRCDKSFTVTCSGFWLSLSWNSSSSSSETNFTLHNVTALMFPTNDSFNSYLTYILSKARSLALSTIL